MSQGLIKTQIAQLLRFMHTTLLCDEQHAEFTSFLGDGKAFSICAQHLAFISILVKNIKKSFWLLFVVYHRTCV